MMNHMIHDTCDHMIQVSLLVYNDDGQLDVSSVIPMIDGGTEGKFSIAVIICSIMSCTSGFKGNARVILPGVSACVDFTLDLYPPQVGGAG